MPDPRDATTVAPQITDAVTQANVMVLGSAPAVAVGMLYQTTMQALMLAMKVLGDAPARAMATLHQAVSNAAAMAAANAVHAQQQANVTHQAATTAGVSTLLGRST